ncbi:MAG: hypothetical protein AAFP76_15700, partial [Bacteroidota bacterium]
MNRYKICTATADSLPLRKLLFFAMATLLFYTSGFSQREIPLNEEKVDSIIHSLDTLGTQAKKVKLLTSTAGQNRYTPVTRKLIDKALEISESANDYKLLAHSHYSLGNYHYFNSKTDSCLSSLDRASNYLKDVSDPLLEASVLSTRGG